MGARRAVPAAPGRHAAAQLSRAAALDRALALADAEGLEAVTIRRLAQEFGVTPMALYWHVRNKDELLDAMGDRLFADTVIEEDASSPWHEQLRAIVVGLTQALRAHPGAVSLSFARVLQGEHGLDLAERALAVLRGAGFSTRQAAQIASHALRTAVMLVTDEPGAEIGKDAMQREEALRAKRAMLAALPAERYPRVIEAAADLLDCDDEQEYYDFGIDLFIAGARATLDATRRPRPAPGR